MGAYAYAKEAKTTAVTPLNKKNVRGLIEKLFQDDPIYQPTVNRLKECVSCGPCTPMHIASLLHV